MPIKSFIVFALVGDMDCWLRDEPEFKLKFEVDNDTAFRGAPTEPGCDPND